MCLSKVDIYFRRKEGTGIVQTTLRWLYWSSPKTKSQLVWIIYIVSYSNIHCRIIIIVSPEYYYIFVRLTCSFSLPVIKSISFWLLSKTHILTTDTPSFTVLVFRVLCVHLVLTITVLDKRDFLYIIICGIICRFVEIRLYEWNQCWSVHFWHRSQSQVDSFGQAASQLMFVWECDVFLTCRRGKSQIQQVFNINLSVKQSGVQRIS